MRKMNRVNDKGGGRAKFVRAIVETGMPDHAQLQVMSRTLNIGECKGGKKGQCGFTRW